MSNIDKLVEVIDEEYLELAKMSLADNHNIIIAGGRNAGRHESIQKVLGTIGHVGHGTFMIGSQKFKDALDEVINNVDVKNVLRDRYLGTIDESISYKLHNPYEAILQHEDYYADPLRKKYRKQNNSQHKGSKKKNKQAKQARKKNRKN